MTDEWTWQFRAPAKRTYDGLDAHAQDRITDELDQIVNDRWRDPGDYLEPLTGVPHSKLRIGQFRLYTIRKETPTTTEGDDPFEKYRGSAERDETMPERMRRLRKEYPRDVSTETATDADPEGDA